MIATVINALAVIAGSVLGVIFHKRIQENTTDIIYTGVGIITLVIGAKMALATQRIVFVALALVLGGLLGHALKIESGILRFGDFLKRKFAKQNKETTFAYGFLNASVLFCVGAMALVGSFKAGTEGNYELLLTKSVMDGFVSIILTAAMGIGVAFSTIPILVYQGALTLLSVWLKPLVSDLILSELTGVGGALVLMIGLNLLQLKTIKTANYIPSLVLIVLFVALEPFVPFKFG